MHHSPNLSLIVSGEVRIYRCNLLGMDGARQEISGCLSCGMFFGGLCDNALSPCLIERAVAGSMVEIWSITPTNLSMLFSRSPALALRMMDIVIRQYVFEKNQRSILSSQNVKSRLSSVLLDLMERFGGNRGTGSATLGNVSQQDIADIIGASRSFVSTIINEMKQDGILASKGRSTVILRPDILAQYSLGTDPSICFRHRRGNSARNDDGKGGKGARQTPVQEKGNVSDSSEGMPVQKTIPPGQQEADTSHQVQTGGTGEGRKEGHPDGPGSEMG